MWPLLFILHNVLYGAQKTDRVERQDNDMRFRYLPADESERHIRERADEKKAWLHFLD
jgi:hypothetical protein